MSDRTPLGRRGDDEVEAAYAAALASLPGIGPATLAGILEGRDPSQAWAAVRAGEIERPPPRRRPGSDVEPPGSQQSPLFGPPPAPAGAPDARGSAGSGDRPDGAREGDRSWALYARRLDPVGWWRPWMERGVRVTWRGQPTYPVALADDPQPPGVLFWMGDIGRLSGLSVAVVGTRNATPTGRSIAFAMGRDLATAGVCVVSGLALGIDGAAHAGAVKAVTSGAAGTTVGVAASGVDTPYPRRHSMLWRDVIRVGAVVSETPPGRPAQAWRFPSRNRVIAGLVSMVVVVESHHGGGSLITAEAAMDRGVEVRVVPGPVLSPASAGSNQLLYDGPGPVRDARDVLDALGILLSDGGKARGPTGPPPDPLERRLDPVARRLLEALGQRPASTSQLMHRSRLDAATAMAALDRLVEMGAVTGEGGWWARVG